MTKTEATHAMAGVVSKEVPRTSEHASGTDHNSHAPNLNSPSATQMVASNSGEDGTDDDEQHVNVCQRLLCCSELAGFYQFTGVGIRHHGARAERAVEGLHPEHSSGIPLVKLLNPSS